MCMDMDRSRARAAAAQRADAAGCGFADAVSARARVKREGAPSHLARAEKREMCLRSLVGCVTGPTRSPRLLGMRAAAGAETLSISDDSDATRESESPHHNPARRVKTRILAMKPRVRDGA